MIAANRFRPTARRLACTMSRRFKSATPATEQGTAAAATADKAAVETSSTRLMLQSLAAAGAGIVTVSIAAFAVEQSTANSVPKYHPKRQRFDASTFGGRFAQMLMACDPRLLLYTSEQVKQAQALLERYQEANVSDRALWEAKRVVTAALHPDTGDVIFRPFRMSGMYQFVALLYLLFSV